MGQHDRPAACVIAQQYSSATYVLLRFHSRKDTKTTRTSEMEQNVNLY
jgi:hypothetical protein